MNEKTIKAIGFFATLAGMALTLVSNWAGEKQQKAQIAEEVAKAIQNQTKGS